MATSRVAPGKPASTLDASGGIDYTIDEKGTTYQVHRFEESGSFTVLGGHAWVEYLIVGGGGGGGQATWRGGAGGGAGGLLMGKHFVEYDGTPSGQIFPVVVGSGGSGLTGSDGGDGSPTEIFGLTALGGGGGARNRNTLRAGRFGASSGASIATGSTMLSLPNFVPGQGSRGQRTTSQTASDWRRHGQTGGHYPAEVYQTPNNGRSWFDGADGNGLPYSKGFISDFDGTIRHYSIGGLFGFVDLRHGDAPRHFGQGGMGAQGGRGSSTTSYNGGNGGDGVVILRYPIAFNPTYGQV